jgi:hypothetical protein
MMRAMAMERGQRNVLVGVLVMALVIAVVWLLPEGLRVAWFLIGLAGGATISLMGGLTCLRSVSQDGATVGRVVGAVVGLCLGVTVAVLTFWATLGVLG